MYKGYSESLEESYISRCVLAMNLYVETHNKNMESMIINGRCSPLSRKFKADRFKSMTNQEWLESYEGVIRWNKINMVVKRIGDDIGTKGMVSQAH